MTLKAQPFDTSKFITTSQVGGIEAYTINEGPARGVRAFCVNTGGGLRYRVLADRGLDIEQAFFNQHSLAFLTHVGVNPPTRAMDRGLDWLRSFYGGLLTSCGPFNIGGPCTDAGEELGLHGPHSNTAATIESIIQPDAHAGRLEMSIVGRIRYGSLYNPCVELKRTIISRLGQNSIDITDEFYNAGNQDVPHAWLLHINFGYPLLNAGGEFCYAAEKVEPIAGDINAAKHFAPTSNYRRIPEPMDAHSGPTSFVGYIYPRADGTGQTRVAVVNPKLNLGVAIEYNINEFSRCVHWQHWGKYEYVGALEPAAGGTVEGRDKDRQRTLLLSIEPGQKRAYHYSIQVVSDTQSIQQLMSLSKT
jgi:hypothetical protein